MVFNAGSVYTLKRRAGCSQSRCGAGGLLSEALLLLPEASLLSRKASTVVVALFGRPAKEAGRGAKCACCSGCLWAPRQDATLCCSIMVPLCAAYQTVRPRGGARWDGSACGPGQCTISVHQEPRDVRGEFTVAVQGSCNLR